MNFIAVEGLTLSASFTTGGTITITSIPSLKVKADGKKIYKGELSFSVVGASAPGYTSGSVSGTGTILPTSVKALVEGSPPLRENDQAVVVMTGLVGQTTTPFNDTWTIIKAGQNKVRSN